MTLRLKTEAELIATGWEKFPGLHGDWFGKDEVKSTTLNKYKMQHWRQILTEVHLDTIEKEGQVCTHNTVGKGVIHWTLDMFTKDPDFVHCGLHLTRGGLVACVDWSKFNEPGAEFPASGWVHDAGEHVSASPVTWTRLGRFRLDQEDAYDLVSEIPLGLSLPLEVGVRYLTESGYVVTLEEHEPGYNWLYGFTASRRVYRGEVGGNSRVWDFDGASITGENRISLVARMPIQDNIQSLPRDTPLFSSSCNCYKEKHGFTFHTNWCNENSYFPPVSHKEPVDKNPARVTEADESGMMAAGLVDLDNEVAIKMLKHKIDRGELDPKLVQRLLHNEAPRLPISLADQIYPAGRIK